MLLIEGRQELGRRAYLPITTRRGNALEPQSQKPDTSAIKERQRKICTSGDYAKIGNPLVILSELLCEAVDLRAREIGSSAWRPAAVYQGDSALAGVGASGGILGQSR